MVDAIAPPRRRRIPNIPWYLRSEWFLRFEVVQTGGTLSTVLVRSVGLSQPRELSSFSVDASALVDSPVEKGRPSEPSSYFFRTTCGSLIGVWAVCSSQRVVLRSSQLLIYQRRPLARTLAMESQGLCGPRNALIVVIKPETAPNTATTDAITSL